MHLPNPYRPEAQAVSEALGCIEPALEKETL